MVTAYDRRSWISQQPSTSGLSPLGRSSSAYMVLKKMPAKFQMIKLLALLSTVGLILADCPSGGDSVGAPVNGMCPTGYEPTQVCCSAAAAADSCPDGLKYVAKSLGGSCPPAAKAYGSLCCSEQGVLYGVCETPGMRMGMCMSAGSAGCPLGYACSADIGASYCCPVVNYSDPQNVLGPTVGGLCPSGYIAVYPPSAPNGECVSLQSVPGICPQQQQVGACTPFNSPSCPSGFSCFSYAGVCCP